MPSANEPYAAARERRPNDEPTVLVRKLGSAGVPTYLERVLTQDGEHRFVVVERLARGGMTDDEASECLREARTAADFEHPNVVPTRAITVRYDEISVTSDYVAGERLSDLWSSSPLPAKATLPLEIALRILVDVATGLGALHKLRSSEGHERARFVHGEVTAANVLVGLDGISALLRAARVRRAGTRSSTSLGTMSPEVLLGVAVDHRADVYSLGALLWQSLSRRPLFPDDDVDAILASIKRGPAERAIMTGQAPWALPLADVAARALAPSPDKRFPTTSSMVTELRKIAGPKLATAEQVAQFVEAKAGAKIAARLADVQASAVIRKATSIPAPRSLPPQSHAIAEPESGPAWLSTPDDRARESKRPSREPEGRREALPQPTPEPLVSPARVTEVAAPPVPSSLAPAKPIFKPVQPLVALPPPPPPARPTPSARAPRTAPPFAEPTTLPRSQAPSRAPKRTPSLSAEPKSSPRSQRTPSPLAELTTLPRVQRAPSPLAHPATSPRPQRMVRLLLGVWLAVALLTGLFAFRAVRNRQVIATPGATPIEPSMTHTPTALPPNTLTAVPPNTPTALPPNTPTALPPKEQAPDRSALRGAVPRAQPTRAPETATADAGRAAKPTAPTKAPSPAPRRK